jgi:branched-chain amino acid transport system ATP-binding protein
MLSLRSVAAGYGATPVLDDIDLTVGPGEVVCLMGRNGVGKSTMLKVAMGLVRATAGQVAVGDRTTTRLRSHLVAREGVSYAAQERGLFANLTVRDNLKLAAAGDPTTAIEEASALFGFIGARLDQRAGTLSGGEQKMLLTARALSGAPRLALLDEISEGVQPSLIAGLRDAVIQANARHGTAVLIVEQHIELALSVATRFYMLEKGRIVAAGATADPDAEQVIHRHLII